MGFTADAEEVTQDGFVNAFRALSGFRAGAAFRPWLLSIVANQARNRRRAAGRRMRMELRSLSAARSESGPPSPEEVVEKRARRQALPAQNGVRKSKSWYRSPLSRWTYRITIT